MSDRKLEERVKAVEDQLAKVMRILKHNNLEGPPPGGQPQIFAPPSDEEIAEWEREGDELVRELDEEIAREGDSL